MKKINIFLLLLSYLTLNSADFSTFLQANPSTINSIEYILYEIRTLHLSPEEFAQKIAQFSNLLVHLDLNFEDRVYFRNRLLCTAVSNENLHQKVYNQFLSVFLLAEEILRRTYCVETKNFSENIKHFKYNYTRDLENCNHIKGLFLLPNIVPIQTYEQGIEILESNNLSKLEYSCLIQFLKEKVMDSNLNTKYKNTLLRKIISTSIKNYNLHRKSICRFIDIFTKAESLDKNRQYNLTYNIRTKRPIYKNWITEQIKVIDNENKEYENALALLNS